MKKIISIISFLISLPICATLHHIYTIKEVIEHINECKTLVVFDIDNTLLHPKTDLGSDQWFTHLVHHHVSKGCDIEKAINQVLPVYRHVNHHIDLIPTEPDLADTVAIIKEKSDMVMCLTARSMPLAEVTHAQLQKNNLHFHVPYVITHQPQLKHPWLHLHGVVYGGNNNKGEVLFAFLESVQYHPERVIIIDDKEKNLQAIKTACEQRSIECIALRYAGCDARVSEFDHHETEKELDLFLRDKPLIVAECS
ncbi:hypothetical protein Noda2021_01650 [Candidatus Dependentiae bacterium Noda2021]|nr:hypothetical protein Noda2021_01650 [Candidatus Dependentiae bacterium Noda2021]